VVRRFLQVNHKYVRPLITGSKAADRVHSPGAHILHVFRRLNEHDALTLSRAPTDPAELVRWNASLKNIAAVLRNHTSADLPHLSAVVHCVIISYRIISYHIMPTPV